MSPSARITILQHVLLHGSMSAVLTLSSSVTLVDGACHNNILRGLRSWQSIRPCSWADCTAALLSSPTSDHLFQGFYIASPIAGKFPLPGNEAVQDRRVRLQQRMGAGT